MSDRKNTEPEIQSHRHDGAQKSKFEYLPAFFLAAALIFLPTQTGADSLNTLAIVFISIVLEAIPFMLIGSLVGGLIEAFVSRERLTALLPRKGWLTVCAAAGAGIIFPVCECAVIPVVRRLIGKGLPMSAAIAYLLGGPIVNPVVAASTALAYSFDWRVVLLRLGLGYAIACAVGLLMGKRFKNGGAVSVGNAAYRENASSCGCHQQSQEHTPQAAYPGELQTLPVITGHEGAACGCNHTISDHWLTKTSHAFAHARDDFFAVGHYLVIGAFIAALAQTYIDRSWFLSLTAMPVVSVILMMGLAILLNLCSEADAFIAASLRGMMPLPAQIAFLLTGPMFDLKLLLMYQTVFTRKAILVLASLILSAVLAIALCLVLIQGGMP